MSFDKYFKNNNSVASNDFNGKDTIIHTYNSLPSYARMNNILRCSDEQTKLKQQIQYYENILYNKFTQAIINYNKNKGKSILIRKKNLNRELKKNIFPQNQHIILNETSKTTMNKLLSFNLVQMNKLIKQLEENKYIMKYINKEYLENLNDDKEKKLVLLKLLASLIENEPVDENYDENNINALTPYYITLNIYNFINNPDNN